MLALACIVFFVAAMWHAPAAVQETILFLERWYRYFELIEPEFYWVMSVSFGIPFFMSIWLLFKINRKEKQCN